MKRPKLTFIGPQMLHSAVRMPICKNVPVSHVYVYIYTHTHAPKRSRDNTRLLEGLLELKCRMGGLRDGGLSKFADICGKRPLCPALLDFPGTLRALWKRTRGRKRAKKGRKGRLPGRAARHPLNPHLCYTPLAAA